jgi:16S rRNA (uracil1498-N3)-methyltransferase
MIPRLYVSDDLTEGGRIAPDPRAAHYLRNVLRRSVGDELHLFNGRDGEFAARLSVLNKRDIDIEILGRSRAQSAAPDLWLCFAPLKKDPTDFLIEKGTELGARLFQPVSTRRTNAQRVNAERLRANAIEAAEQTERLDIPEIASLVDLDTLLARWPGERRLILCAEAGPARPIAEALLEFKPSVKNSSSWAILCGPEGGFQRSELDQISNLPFVTPVGLGPRILRAETAALAAMAIFQSILGDGDRRTIAALATADRAGR